MHEISASQQQGTLVLSVVGRVEAGNAPDLEREVVAEIEKGAISLVLDCSRLDYIASAGLRVLLVVAQRINDDEGQFAVAAVPHRIREILAISGFDQVISVADSPEQAISGFN
jgi:stage II sporulation protein AA (anti-sigma F factor antagonist)